MASQQRPDVMDSLTAAKLKEVELQFEENDREEFNRLAQTYG